MLLLLTLSQQNIARFADKGPQARTPEVAAWQELWGSRSELRRFKDGSILYTNVWSCKPGENYAIPVEIVRYILSIHTMAVTKFTLVGKPLLELVPHQMSSPRGRERVRLRRSDGGAERGDEAGDGDGERERAQSRHGLWGPYQQYRPDLLGGGGGGAGADSAERVPGRRGVGREGVHGGGEAGGVRGDGA